MADYVIIDKANTQTESIGFSRPDTTGTKAALKKKYGGISGLCASYLQFIANQYNAEYTTSVDGFNNATKVYNRLSPVEEINRNFDYYTAQQDNYMFAYMAQGSEGQELQAPWTAGHEVYETVQHMLGPMQKHFSSVKLTVESLDPSVQSIRQLQIAMIDIKKKLPRIFAEFAKMGVEFVPEGTQTDMDMAMIEVARKPAHKVELYGLDVMNHINNVNSYKDFFPKRYRDVIIGRYCGIHLESFDGRISYQAVAPQYLVWDRGNEDDDYNRYCLYKGFISWHSKEEVMMTYDLGPDASEVLDDVFDSSNGGVVTANLSGVLNNLTPATGFRWSETGDISRVACCTGYFIARLYSETDGWYTTYYGGTLIGNRILVNYGEGTNIVYDNAKPEWPVLPIAIFSPDTVRGKNVCPVDRFRQQQDDCDAFMYRIREKISTDLGKTYFVFAESLGGDAVEVGALIADLKQHKMTVLSRANGEEPITQGRAIEMVDMSLDPNIMNYVALRKEMMQDMRDVVSQSRITQGMQQTYIGGGTQQQTISQASNGTIMLLQGFFQFFAMFEEYVLNVAKVMLLDAKNEDEADLIFNESSKEFWKEIQNMTMSAMQVRVELEDIIDDSLRAELNGMALAWAQNFKETGFGPVEWLKTKTARTTRELLHDMTETFKLKEMKAERIRQQDMQMQQQSQQMQLQAMQQQQQMKDESSAQREIIRQTPNMKKVGIEQQKIDLEKQQAGMDTGSGIGQEIAADRNMSFASEEGVPGTSPM